MNKFAVAAASLASLAAVSVAGFAQTASRGHAPLPSTSGVATRSPGAPVAQFVVGYPCEVVTSGDVTTVYLKSVSYCGGTDTGHFIMQRQYGSGIETAQPQIGYDVYGGLVDRLIESSWRKVGAEVVGGGYARSVSFKAQ